MPLLTAPIQNYRHEHNISQMFGVNRDTYRRLFNLPAHNAIDIVQVSGKLGYGTPLISPFDYEYVRISYDTPDRTRGHGIYVRSKKFNSPISIHGSTAYYAECPLWHLADFDVTEGASGLRGNILARMGNTGQVFPKPSNKCPLCPFYGTHVHFGLRFLDINKNIIHNGFYQSGYVDPIPFMHNEGDKYPIRFLRDLYFARTGDDVGWLQTLLKIEGFGNDYEPTGFYGYKTLRDVRKLQQKYGISATGYFGSQTRGAVKKYCAV